MKKPEEVKKGLETCVSEDSSCADCPYAIEFRKDLYVCHGTKRAVIADAIAYIQQLEADKIRVLEESHEIRKDMLGKIQQLEAQVPRWISVEERMPEDFVSVIGYLPINSGEGFPPTREVYHTEQGWYVPALGGLCIVTHWMPLPKAPEEDAHE